MLDRHQFDTKEGLVVIDAACQNATNAHAVVLDVPDLVQALGSQPNSELRRLLDAEAGAFERLCIRTKTTSPDEPVNPRPRAWDALSI